jgi:hypothetical protein
MEYLWYLILSIYTRNYLSKDVKSQGLISNPVDVIVEQATKFTFVMAIHQRKMARFALAMTAFAGIGALIAFATLLGVQVTAQQQITPAENHHPNSNSSNQSGIGSTAEQRQNTTITTVGGGMMINQTSNINWISLVRSVNVSGISIIDNEHIATDLRYDGEGEPPGVSVVAMTSSSSDTIIVDSMMQNSTTSGSNSSLGIMQSGSNYLEAGWQVQRPNSATVIVQLDGEIAEGEQIIVMVVPFLHH